MYKRAAMRAQMIAPSASMTIVERIPSTKRSKGTRFTAFASNLSSRPRSATTIQKPMHQHQPAGDFAEDSRHRFGERLADKRAEIVGQLADKRQPLLIRGNLGKRQVERKPDRRDVSQRQKHRTEPADDAGAVSAVADRRHDGDEQEIERIFLHEIPDLFDKTVFVNGLQRAVTKEE